MGYGICLYGLADEQYTSKIFLMQKRAIRLLSNAAFTAHTKPLFDNLKILNFEKTINYNFSLLMWEQDYGDLPQCFKDYLKKRAMYTVTVHAHLHKINFPKIFLSIQTCMVRS